MGTDEGGSDLAFESRLKAAANQRKDHSELAFKALAEDFPDGPEKVALVVKNPPITAGDIRDTGSFLGSGRFPGGGHATPSSILAWRIPWTEEPGGLQSLGLHRVIQT